MNQALIDIGRFALGAVLLASAAACAGVPPKVLVAHDFMGSDKSSKLLLQTTGQVDPSSGMLLFNVSIRMCDVAAAGESACQETNLLENVAPGSVY
jgi:hypothetical protein